MFYFIKCCASLFSFISSVACTKQLMADCGALSRLLRGKAATNEPTLPPGWTKAFSKKKNKPFYYHQATKTCSWNFPNPEDPSSATSGVSSKDFGERAAPGDPSSTQCASVDSSYPQAGQQFECPSAGKATPAPSPHHMIESMKVIAALHGAMETCQDPQEAMPQWWYEFPGEARGCQTSETVYNTANGAMTTPPVLNAMSACPQEQVHAGSGTWPVAFHQGQSFTNVMPEPQIPLQTASQISSRDESLVLGVLSDEEAMERLLQKITRNDIHRLKCNLKKPHRGICYRFARPCC